MYGSSFRDIKGNLQIVFSNFFSPTGFVSNTPLILIHTVVGICWHWHDIDIVFLVYVLPLPTCLTELDSASKTHISLFQKAMSTWWSFICNQSNWGDCTSSGISIKPQSLVIINLLQNTFINPTTPPPDSRFCLQRDFKVGMHFFLS